MNSQGFNTSSVLARCACFLIFVSAIAAFGQAGRGSISGTIKYDGPKPKPHVIDMSDDPACVKANNGKVYDQSLITEHGGLGNAFVFIEKGLEGKQFAPPAAAVSTRGRRAYRRSTPRSPRPPQLA